jgi:hypothetical protein
VVAHVIIVTIPNPVTNLTPSVSFATSCSISEPQTSKLYQLQALERDVNAQAELALGAAAGSDEAALQVTASACFEQCNMTCVHCKQQQYARTLHMVIA